MPLFGTGAVCSPVASRRKLAFSRQPWPPPAPRPPNGPLASPPARRWFRGRRSVWRPYCGTRPNKPCPDTRTTKRVPRRSPPAKNRAALVDNASDAALW